MQNAELTLGSDDADPNCLAVAFRVLQPRLLGSSLRLEGLRERRKLAADIFEEEPPLSDFGHLKFIAQPSPTCGT